MRARSKSHFQNNIAANIDRVSVSDPPAIVSNQCSNEVIMWSVAMLPLSWLPLQHRCGCRQDLATSTAESRPRVQGRPPPKPPSQLRGRWRGPSRQGLDRRPPPRQKTMAAHHRKALAVAVLPRGTCAEAQPPSPAPDTAPRAGAPSPHLAARRGLHSPGLVRRGEL